MFQTIVSTITAGCLALASTTALALPNLDATPTDSSEQVLESGSLVDDEGRRISYEIWIDDGVIYGDARVEDTHGNHLELWREGDVIHYEGVLGGEAAAGELPADIDANTEQAFCPGWLVLLCIGAAFLTSGGCTYTGGCVEGDKPETEVPDGQGGVPEEDEEDEPIPPGGGDAE